MEFLPKLIQFIDRINERLGRIVSWSSLVLVLIVVYDVVKRYLLRESSVAIQELEWHIFAFMFLMAAGYTLKHDKHVRVDVLYQRMPEKRQHLVNLIGSVLFLIPFTILVIWASQNFVIMSYTISEGSPDPGGLPYRFILKSMIPIGFFFVLLQGIATALKSFAGLRGGGTQNG
jgi:TRAP-type mannitol/chloroaromatic compound transport system permease small subunit